MSNDHNRRDPYINQPRNETGQPYPRPRQPRRPDADPYPAVGQPAAPGGSARGQVPPAEATGGDAGTPAGPRGTAGGGFDIQAGPPSIARGHFGTQAGRPAETDGRFGTQAARPGTADGRFGTQAGRPGVADGRFGTQAGRPGTADGGFGAQASPPGVTGGDGRAPAGQARSLGDGRGGPAGRIPAPGGPTSASRKRSRSPWVFGGLLLIVVLGLAGVLVVALGGGGSIRNALGLDQNSKKAVDGRMNTPIADGTFEFTVTGARCGLDKVGEGKTVQPAQGQFCLIDVTVTNVGSSPVIFDDISQTAYDATGNQYSADSTADVAANKGQPAFLRQITPGETVQGRLAFDISTRETLTSVVLHESIFSNGVRIPLG